MSDKEFIEFLSKAQNAETFGEGYGPKMPGVVRGFEMAHKQDSLPCYWKSSYQVNCA